MNWHLFDLAPTAWLLLLFIAVACFPLAWLARAVRGQSRAEKMAALAALLVTRLGGYPALYLATAAVIVCGALLVLKIRSVA